MQQTNYIKHSTIDQIKDHTKKLFDDQTPINVVVKKTRTKSEKHDVIIEGIYPKFFTVKNMKTKLSFTIQYIDIITGNITITEIEQKEGD